MIETLINLIALVSQYNFIFKYVELHWGDFESCLYFTLKESKLIFKSVSKTFLFKIASLEDNKLFPIFVLLAFAHLKYVSLEEIVWFSFSSTQSKDGW